MSEEASVDYSSTFFDNAVAASINSSIITEKANACPMAVRLAWHASGTYEAKTGSGGSDGSTMRFEPEVTDGANAGLTIAQDILKPVQHAFQNLSVADIWTRAGCKAVELSGGPKVPFNYGRTDAADGSYCPPNGRLPDASQGAEHLRNVFNRMGFGDKEIVALSGAHTLGRCHKTRSGFDGPWTSNPLKFDNEYFRNLINLKWSKREWDGNEQYADESGELMMLPTDIALIQDPGFRPWVERYAADQDLFFADFSEAFSRLISNGCPAHCFPAAAAKKTSQDNTDSIHFREHAMHGSLERMKQYTQADPHSKEANSQRTALHKASYWGHVQIVEYLISERGVDVNAKDSKGDIALHDAARFGHESVVHALIKGGSDLQTKNNDKLTPAEVASNYGKDNIVKILNGSKM